MAFFAKFGIVRTFLFNSFSIYKAKLMLTVLGGSKKVNPSVNACNITDIGHIPFLDIISDRDMQKILALLV